MAAAILAVGTLLRPPPAADTPTPPGPSQAELRGLARLAQRRSLESMAQYFATVAGDLETAVVGVRGLGRSGIVWEPGLVVTTRLEPRFPDATTVSNTTGELGVATVGSGPHLPLATLRVPEAGGFVPATRGATTQLAAGDWMLFVSNRGRRGFTPATYLATSELRCAGQVVGDVATSITLAAELAGAGLFDLDGGLLAVVLACDERYAAVPVGDVDLLVRRAATLHSRLAHRYGMGLTDPTPAERAHLHAPTGVLVREVWTGYLADASGIRPGDVIVAINAEPIVAVDQLGPLVDPGEFDAFDVAVRRGDDILAVRVPSDPRAFVGWQANEASDGLVWDDTSSRHRIDSVIPGTAADRAGLRAGDRLVRVDHAVPDDLAAVRAALASTREAPVLLELERAGRRWAVVLP